MKILVIGLGSMGKRRIRNLRALGVKEIAGIDIRADRILEAEQKYNIKAFSTFEEAIDSFLPENVIISVSPENHTRFIKKCLSKKINCFVEASVTDKHEIYELSKIADTSKMIIAPSCTMMYFPGPRKIKELIKSNIYGKVINFTYYCGQYLPDWHPWEDINDYYVSNRETGGCREIVPFELVWINDIFGYPDVLSGIKGKISDIKADIDDIYQVNLIYPGKILANLNIDIIAKPHARREMFVNLEKGQIIFDGDQNIIRHTGKGEKEWKIEELPSGTKEDLYINPEEPYIQEIKDFLEACRLSDQNIFPNTLLRDWTLLNLLTTIEANSITI